jgi:hypothetical protein
LTVAPERLARVDADRPPIRQNFSSMTLNG